MTTKDHLIGTLFDRRYRIERRIGHGGMADVYLAHDETLGRDVAIKVLSPRYARDEQFVERFLREASAAARLNHPNIVQVYDRGEFDDTYYIAMEYVEGTTLKEIITAHAPLPEAQLRSLTRQALAALRFAHRNGVVHRDIKPHNMMVDGEGTLKIADFGIARAGVDSGLTEAGSIVGTAQYLSPEQAQGHSVSAPSDLYSLGVTMFEMATGRVPFDGDSPVNVALKHVRDDVPRPSAFGQVSPALEAVILRAMQKDPAVRYQSADEFRADLDRSAKGEVASETATITRVIAARDASANDDAPTRITPPVRTGAMKPPPASRDVASAYNGTGYDDDWDRRERKRRFWPWLLLLVLIAALVIAAYFVWSSVLAKPKVPDVTGQTLSAAKQTLSDDGFVTGKVTRRVDDTQAKGHVVAQDPGAGNRADKGSSVDLAISKGSGKVSVPSFSGSTVADAKAAAAQLGLKLAVTKTHDPDHPAGKIFEQSPDANTDVDPGSSVSVTVSQGAPQVSVPDVSGQSSNDAQTLLQRAGLSMKIVPVNSATPEGQVSDQDPAANTKVDPGTLITLHVGSGRNAVPKVVGEPVYQAQTAITNAGFTPQVEDSSGQPSSDQNAVVTGQDPSAGTSHSLGTSITLITAPAQAPPTSTGSTTTAAPRVYGWRIR